MYKRIYLAAVFFDKKVIFFQKKIVFFVFYIDTIDFFNQ